MLLHHVHKYIICMADCDDYHLRVILLMTLQCNKGTMIGLIIGVQVIEQNLWMRSQQKVIQMEWIDRKKNLEDWGKMVTLQSTRLDKSTMRQQHQILVKNFPNIRH